MKRFIILALSLVLVLFLIPSCITVQAPASLITPPAGQPSVIGTFSSYPSTINPGGTSNLSWNVTGANSISIDNGIGLVNASGTMVVSPATSTVYTVSATNSAGTVTRSAVTMVNSVSSQPVGTPPVIIEFSSNPSIINSAGTSNLSWNVTGADSASIDNGIGQVNASGTMAVSPATSTTYTIIAANYNSTVTSSTTIIVNAGGISGTSSAGTDTIWH